MKEILKYLRQLNSLTQEEAAAGISVSRQTYSKYEKGTVVPSDETVRRLADLYNVRSNFIRKSLTKPYWNS
ncbi:MAG: helix-turn-helix transcriptional regulator [Treponema sp.]|nr:helix-turn-helix transcriptional regulator [Treponema sp.]